MQIYVNDQQLNATLSGEKNLAEVYEAINRWSSDNRKYILNLLVDSREISVKGLASIPTEAVHRVDFYIGDEIDMVLSTLDELDRYLDQIGSTLFEMENIAANEANNLKDGVHWIRQIITSVASILHIDLGGSVLSSQEKESESMEAILAHLEKGSEAFLSGSDKQSIEAFLEDLRSFKAFVMRLILQLKMIGAGMEEIQETVEEFESKTDELNKEIVSINELLGAGKDREALDQLESVCSTMNRYVTALYALDYHLSRQGEKTLSNIVFGEVSFMEIAGELTELLRDLTSALEENDMVALGDILEYELTAKITSIQPYLTEIRQIIIARK